MYLFGVMGAISISGSSYRGNSASTLGGAISVQSTNPLLSITSSNFTQNTAQQNGAALYIVGSTQITMTGVTLDSNSAVVSGGGIHYQPKAAQPKMTITSCTITNNKAQSGAGVSLVSAASSPIVYVDNSNTYTGNVASLNGGGVYAHGSLQSVTIQSSNYSGNQASTGGALFSSDPITFSITGTTFTNNKASGSGGAVSMTSASQVSMTTCTVSNNEAGAAGGGPLSLRNSTTKKRASTDGINLNLMQFLYNIAANGGGLSMVTGSNNPEQLTAAVYNSIFAHNAASKQGGGLMTSAGALYKNITFLSNTATQGGSALLLNGNTGCKSLIS